jgi:hypothetical protein
MRRATSHPDPLHVPQADIDRATRWIYGQPVTLTQENGTPIDTYTRSAPWRLANGTWVILVAGFGGVQALARVRERS